MNSPLLFASNEQYLISIQNVGIILWQLSDGRSTQNDLNLGNLGFWPVSWAVSSDGSTIASINNPSGPNALIGNIYLQLWNIMP